MTVVTLLSYMQVLRNELQTGAGEADETRAITALNMAQDLFDGIAAGMPGALRKGTLEVSTTALGEKTALPATLLRIDGLQPLDGTGGKPVGGIIHSIQEVGGHVQSVPWPIQVLLSTSAPGRPLAYWNDAAQIYWGTLPDAVYYYRAYGYVSPVDLAARGDTFALPDIAALPLATIAVKCLALGVDDSVDQIEAFAQQVFAPVFKALKKFNRQRGSTRLYSRIHTT